MDFILEILFPILAIIVRFLGMATFGVAASWLTLAAFRQPDNTWQLQIAVFLGYFAFAAVLVRFATPGALGGYAIGAGAALLAWGLRKTDATPEKKKSTKK